jgi:hypothetical protein
VVIDKMKETGIRKDFIVLVGGAPLNEGAARPSVRMRTPRRRDRRETAKSLVAQRRATRAA